MTTKITPPDLSLVLMHHNMVDKRGTKVTTSLTLIDVHDFARSARTYGVTRVYIAHPAPTLRKLAHTLQDHWEEGFGATYNPNRKEAFEVISIVSDLDEAIRDIDMRTGKLPTLVATSAKQGPDRMTFSAFREELHREAKPYLLMFGTGWGMSDELIARADYFLAPINGPTEYNHLSVRAACAIMLDRLFGK